MAFAIVLVFLFGAATGSVINETNPAVAQATKDALHIEE